MNAPKIVKKRDGTVLIERFSPIRRVEHLLVIVAFVVLVVTGFPQKFQGTWSAWLLGAMGGLDSARFVHRAAGVLFSIEAVVHLAAIVVGTVAGRMRLTLMPTPQDLRDAWGNLRYFLGFQPEQPQFPKFDYRQKFEYMGIILGGLVMVGSGLVLMFPALVATWLPGTVIPAARLAHSSEAMLAFLVLVVWHVYGSNLAPEVFPLDPSIFTGYLTEEELRERHALEYKRLFPKGKEAPDDTGSPRLSPSPSETRAPSS